MFDNLCWRPVGWLALLLSLLVLNLIYSFKVIFEEKCAIEKMYHLLRQSQSMDAPDPAHALLNVQTLDIFGFQNEGRIDCTNWTQIGQLQSFRRDASKPVLQAPFYIIWKIFQKCCTKNAVKLLFGSHF